MILQDSVRLGMIKQDYMYSARFAGIRWESVGLVRDSFRLVGYSLASRGIRRDSD